jgi:hypothetical protein
MAEVWQGRQHLELAADTAYSCRMPSTITRPSVVAAAGLIGGFALARQSHRRELGGALFTAAGAWCAREWRRELGPVAATGLELLYGAAMGGSHPLAKKIGAWPAVLVVAAVVAGAAEVAQARSAR